MTSSMLPLLLQDGVRICPVASEIVLSIFLASLHHNETWSQNSWSPAGWMHSQALRLKAYKSTTRCQTGISGRWCAATFTGRQTDDVPRLLY